MITFEVVSHVSIPRIQFDIVDNKTYGLNPKEVYEFILVNLYHVPMTTKIIKVTLCPK